MKSKSEGNKLAGKEILVDQLITFVVGAIFGCGLLVSGMVRRVNIISFLQIHDGWNAREVLKHDTRRREGKLTFVA